MNKIKILNSLMNCGVVAVIRGNTKKVGLDIARACVKGNVKALEITYTNKFATSIISELIDEFSNNDDVVIGAGTVLDPETARQAILSGAEYVVSPSFNEETARVCNRYKVPYIPGVMTINEIVAAHEVGVDIVKLFPGTEFSYSYVNSIKGPLPYCNIMVTGGVNIENIIPWIKSGVDMVGVAGELNTLGEKGNFEEITLMCSKYIKKLNEARG